MYLDADSFTELTDDSIFTLSRMPDRSYEKDYYVQFDLTVEMHMDIVSHKR